MIIYMIVWVWQPWRYNLFLLRVGNPKLLCKGWFMLMVFFLFFLLTLYISSSCLPLLIRVVLPHFALLISFVFILVCCILTIYMVVREDQPWGSFFSSRLLLPDNRLRRFVFVFNFNSAILPSPLPRCQSSHHVPCCPVENGRRLRPYSILFVRFLNEQHYKVFSSASASHNKFIL